MCEILTERSGVLCQMDGNLVLGKTQDEHDKHLEVVLTQTEGWQTNWLN